MSRRVRVSRPAMADLDNMWEYVAEEQSVEAATRLVDSITGIFPLLGTQPAIGRLREEFGARSFPVGNYIIYYRHRKGGIEISHVFHGKRDQQKAWEDQPRAFVGIHDHLGLHAGVFAACQNSYGCGGRSCRDKVVPGQ